MMKTLLLCSLMLGTSLSFLWPPGRQQSSLVVEVSVILPASYRVDSVELESAQSKAGPGVLVGFLEAERRELLRDDLVFNVSFRDSRCDIVYAPKSFTDAIIEGVHVVFGPSCDFSLAPVARQLKFYSKPLLTAGGFAYDFNRPRVSPDSEFHLLTKTGFSFLHTAELVASLFEEMDWRRTKLMYRKNDHQSWSGVNTCALLMSVFVEMGRERLIEMDEVKLDVTDTLYHNDSRMLEENMDDFGIVILCADTDKVRDILLAAEAIGMVDKGEYVFINVDLFASVTSGEYRPWYSPESSLSENLRAKRAMDAVLTVTASFEDTDIYEHFSKEVKRVAEEIFDYDYSGHVNTFVANFHDAALLYATALNETLSEYGASSISNGSLITRQMSNRSLDGVSGRVSIDGNGDRRSDYLLLDFHDDDFHVCGLYHGLSGDFSLTGDIGWPNRRDAPKDTPECGFDNSLCVYKSPELMIASGVFGVVIAAVLVVALLVFRHYKLEADLASMTWKINPDDIEHLDNRDRANSRISLIKLSVASMDSVENLAKKQVYTRTCKYKGSIVAMKPISKPKIVLNRALLLELKRMKETNHDHLVRFVGACLESPRACILTEYCPRGSLQDILEDEDMELVWSLRVSLMHDVCKGMHFLHKSEFGVHGNLKSSNCVVDSRFVVKLSHFGLKAITDELDQCEIEDNLYWKKRLWTAPELLRSEALTGLRHPGTAKGDVYAFGIILQEIVARQGPFFMANSDLEPRDIVKSVRQPPDDELLRPDVVATPKEAGEGGQAVNELMQACWSEEPVARPDFANVKIAILRLNKENESGNILDNLLSRMELYANNLEELVAERTADYLEEKHKCEALLYDLLPQSVARRLIRGQPVTAETFESVTIYFSDIVGFTALCAQSEPLQVVDLLNDLYTYFDAIIGSFDVYKVETIGDAYMVVSGLPVRNGDNHAREIARMSLKLLEAVQNFTIRHRPQEQLRLRIGIHTGMCCAGVVGIKMPRYCLFGDTVNTASRLESTGLPLKIHMSPTTKAVLDNFDQFELEPRGEVEMKGKGKVYTYWLLGEKPQCSSSSSSFSEPKATCSHFHIDSNDHQEQLVENEQCQLLNADHLHYD